MLCWFLSVLVSSSPCSRSLLLGYVRIETRVRLRNFLISCIQCHFSLSKKKKYSEPLWSIQSSRCIQRNWGTWVGMSKLFVFFLFIKTSADVFVLLARVAQFFTLREWCHGHKTSDITTSHVMDADRTPPLPMALETFKVRLDLWRCWGLFICFVKKNKTTICWLWFFK